ncbi:craniofacial development protein 2-like [Penaeus japonicus]|uniref:craniofacial development protein 2-like n=1 Tax=Penaeus japonicus TaxID=27405 RepID=UPI001C717ABE|nr:craniofacial development protein 2-like [Penaeus japonicus]
MYQGKLDIVKKEMEANNCDIVGISELKWTDKGYFRSEDFTVYYSGHESNRTRGVAIICNKMVANAVLGFNPLNDRIMTLRIQCKPINVTIVQVYAPTTAAEETEIEEFYEQLQEVTESIPSQDIVIIMGDFNAKVGSREEKPITGKFGLGDRNTSGDMLVDFCAANDLYWASDHELLIAKLKVRLKKVKKENQPVRYDLQNISNEFTMEVENKFQILEEREMREPCELWENPKGILKEVAEKHIPKRKSEKRNPWLSQGAILIAEKRKEIKKKRMTESTRRQYRQLNSKFQNQARKDKNKYYSDICQDIEISNNTGRSRNMFKKIRELAGKFTAKQSKAIKEENGEIVSEQDQVSERWKEYTRKLYEKDVGMPESDLIDISDIDPEPSILHREVEEALKETSQNIALISHSSKVMLKIIQRRLADFFNEQMPREQAGFRKGRGTRDHIANLRWIIESMREKQRNLVMCFIDYSKAYRVTTTSSGCT